MFPILETAYFVTGFCELYNKYKLNNTACSNSNTERQPRRLKDDAVPSKFENMPSYYLLNDTLKPRPATQSSASISRLLDMTKIEKAEEFMRQDNIIGCNLEEVLQRRRKYTYIGI